ncbi:MAG TPA: hypothetical protein VJP85_10935 [Candidatus Baltobacteraceae bacterium]|nr:hypothetical protein [Candidatus Baltobacteraceae bacterium]
MTITQQFESPEFLSRLAFVRNELPAKLSDPQYKAEILGARGADRTKHPEYSVFIAMTRVTNGKSAWENFEYLAVRSHQCLERHPEGTLPKHFPRLPVPDRPE